MQVRPTKKTIRKAFWGSLMVIAAREMESFDAANSSIVLGLRLFWMWLRRNPTAVLRSTLTVGAPFWKPCLVLVTCFASVTVNKSRPLR